MSPWALGLPAEAGDRNVCTIAALLLANACLLHRRLGEVPDMEGIAKLNQVGGADDPAGVLKDAWDAILKRDYAPVFEPPLAVLDVLPERRWAGHALRILAECANRVADSLSALGYDHAGPLYHRILPNATAYGAFYTNNLSALMLARLALGPDFCDWSDEEAVTRLRIMDPACGTGTLLMAALHVIKERVEAARGRCDGREAGGGDGPTQATGDPEDAVAATEETDALHRALVENVLCGLDVNRTAVQLAACNLTLGAPTVDYRRMNLLTLKHGPQPDGSVRAGSLDILGTSDREDSLHTLIRPLRTMAGLAAQQVDSAADAEFPLDDLDLVLMNPPFTNNKQRNRQFGKDTARRMQQHELRIRDAVEESDEEVSGVINANSVGTFFTPLAERLLDHGRGCLAKVVPVTASVSASGLSERRYLASRFHIERVVTSHDPRRISYSENTGIHESLVVARRYPAADRPPTEFVSLSRMPTTPLEALDAADAILSGNFERWGRVTRWPEQRVRAGDWTPAQWFDPALAHIVLEIEESEALEPLLNRYAIGPAGRRIRDTYQAGDRDLDGAKQLFWSISSDLRRALAGTPEAWCKPKHGKEALAARYWEQRSTLLVAERYDTVSGRLTALWTSEPSVGSGWTPISVSDERRARALAVWWNSTPALLLLLNQRTRKLTYPKWSLAQLRQVRIPTPDNPAWNALADAWEQIRDVELLPMQDAEACEARRVIDEAAAVALEVSTETVAGWRAMLAAEPTVTNRRVGKPES